MHRSFSVRIAATFTAEPLRAVLESWLRALGVQPEVSFAPYNQVHQQLLDPNSLLSGNAGGLNVLLVRPGDLGVETPESADSTARDLLQALENAAARSAVPMLILACPSASDGHAESLFVEVLRQATEAMPGVTLPEFARIDALYPVNTRYDLEADEAAHVPYSPELFATMATFIARHCASLLRKPFKVIAVDCDNTLWSGICGESGPRGVVIDEPCQALQRFLLERRAEGFLLCLASKNVPDDVEAVFRENPHMLIPRDAFVHAAVNWEAKSGNLRNLSTKLGLGLDSFLFLDDNPAEIAEVTANAPAVLALCLPENRAEIPEFLDHLWVLDRLTVTEDDAKRADFYQTEARRSELRDTTSSFQEFIEGLKLEFEVVPLSTENLSRASQLTLRTNQFNANPNPLDEAGLAEACRGARAELINVRDRFGDYGTVGMSLCRMQGERLAVEAFLLSCRALGKGVESRMLRHLGALAQQFGLREIAIHFSDTGRNRPCHDFLEGIAGATWEGKHRLIPVEVAVNCPLVSAGAAHTVNTTTETRLPLVDVTLASTIAHKLRRVEAILEWSADTVRPRPDTSEAFVPPQGEAEEKVAAIWRSVLGLDRVGRNDRFVDLGGDSIQLVRVHAEIQRGFGRKFDLVKLFENPSLAAQAKVACGEDTVVPVITETPTPQESSGAIAIIGMAVRLPGASTPEELWNNLRTGVESISTFEHTELEAPGDPNNPAFIRARGLLDPAVFEGLDGGLFGILPREAEMIDPQHRVFLEICWEALERAGYVPDGSESSGNRTGVYAGCYYDTYLPNNILADPAARLDHLAEAQVGPLKIEFGNDKDHLSTRVAFKLNLKGPSVTVQTACSTSLVAVAHAAMALRSRQCDMVLAGGVTVTVPQKRGYFHKEGGMLSRDGHCRPFDADSSGTVFSNGGGVVLLKRLEDAQRDGDHIHAVLRGFGLNNDGGLKHSYAAPSSEGQADAIHRAHRDAGIDPRTISYVEAHGTATPLGDPIEIAGLTRAFRLGTSDSGFCAVGSLKSNLGHLDTAAGVCGLIKTVLSLENAELPPMLHFAKPNPRIDFSGSPFFINDRLRKWETADGIPRRAGVSAFGVGGTNVHVVLEEAPRLEASHVDEGEKLFVISARDESALSQLADRLAIHAESAAPSDFAAAARTLAFGRKPMTRRASVVARDWKAAAAAFRQKHWTKTDAAAVAPELVWMFPGQGAQFPGMTADLYAAEPGYRADIDFCAEFLTDLLGEDLRDTLFAKDGEAAAERLKRTVLAQPAIFVVEYALARQWQRWGIQPTMMLGHSVGEFTAACLAGVFTLEDGLRLLAVRGFLMSEVPGGSMLSVRLSATELRKRLPAGLDLAAENGPELCVVAGETPAVASFARELEATGVTVRELHTSHAFHSRMMDSVVARFHEFLSLIPLKAPSIQILSSVTGRLLEDQEATDPNYWAAHLRHTVLFHGALEAASSEKDGRIYLEVGPGQTLTTLARQTIGRRAAACLPSCEHPASGAPDRVRMLQSLGELWCCGVTIDWTAVHAPARRVPLPTYPFQRKRHWLPGMTFGGPIEKPREVIAIEEPEIVPAAPADRGSDCAAKCREVLENISGIPGADMADHVGFLELGFDSLLLTQAARELQKQFGTPVSFRDLMQTYPNVGSLAKHLESAAPRKATAAAPVAKATPASESVESGVSGPRTRIDRVSSADDLTEPQRAHLADLTARYNARTRRSKELTQEHRRWHADPRTVNGFNLLWKEMVYQIVATRMKGSRMWDVDGNEYIDMVNGFGPNFLGHAPDFVTEAIQKQLATGLEIGPQCLAAMETSRLFCEVTGNERVCFLNTGSEAVQAAMRIARTVTGRDKILVFDKDYHGNFDAVLVRSVGAGAKRRTLPVAPGIPEAAVGDVIVVPWGRPEALDMIREVAHELAAVLVEPIQSRQPELMPLEFVHEVRKISEESGFLLVFDEVVSGLRQGLQGAQELYGIRADLATYGKIFGGGALPIGIVGGKAKYMDTFDGGQWQYGDESFPEKEVTFFAGTFTRLPLAMAACHAVLTHLKSQGPEYWDAIRARADRLASTVDRMFRDQGIDIRLVNSASQMFLRIGSDARHGNLLYYHLREKGVFVMEGVPLYLTAAHTDAEVDFVIEAFRHAISEMQAGGFFPQSPAAIEGVRGPFPMTEPMSEIWLGSLLGKEANLAFNELLQLRLTGPADLTAIDSAIQDLVDRHDALRMRVPDAHGEGFVIDSSARAAISHEDLRAQPDPEEALAGLGKRERETPFDLIAGPAFRVTVARLTDTETVLLFSAHHLACDGWSFGVLFSEFSKCLAGKRPTLPPAPSIVDRALRQAKRDGTDESALAWWTERFSNGVPELELPLRRSYGVTPVYASSTCELKLDAETLQSCRKLAASCGATLNSTLLAGYQALLHRLSSQERFVMTFPSAGQMEEGDEALVGHCVNFLPLLAEVDPQRSFKDLATLAASAQLDALDHGSVTYGRLLRALKIGRSGGRRPMMEIIFNLESFDPGDAAAKVETVPARYSNSTIFLNIVQSPDGLLLSATYNRELLDEGKMLRWLDAYRQLLLDAARDPSTPVADLKLLGEAAEAELERWSGTTMPALPTSVNERFQMVAARLPFSTALMWKGGSCTYIELAAKSAAIATALQRAGVMPGHCVGIDLARSPELIASIFGILEAGACFVPVDPKYPAARKEQIFTDAGVRLVISLDQSSRPTLNPIDLPPAESLSVGVGPEQPAYVLFTSGSTGVPKGAVVPHRGILRLVVNPDYCELGPEQVILQGSTPAFDAATFEIFGALLNGGRLVLLEEGASLDEIARTIRDAGVNTLWLTAGLFELMVEEHLDDLRGIRQLLSGGDVYSPVHAKRALEGLPGTRLINGYGPTENTTFTACHTLRAEDVDAGTIPIGRPISGTRVEILDARGRRVPAGVPGELCCGGTGLALGYLGRPDLGAAAFVRNPLPGRGNEVLYRTGDLCLWRPDGTIEFIGRRDQQVKIRGFRIELAEIEAALMSHPAIRQSKVAVRGSGSAGKHLMAWVTADEAVSEQDLRHWLDDRLPAYMRPDRILQLSAMPLNANGKVDLAALPEPSAAFIAERSEPQGELEIRLAAIWRELLGIEEIGRDDDFFDLGGNSLIGLRMFARIGREFGASLPLSTLLRAKNVRALAAIIGNGADQKGSHPAHLATIQPLGHLPPIFAIHGGDGGVIFYRELAERLSQDRPFHAIESPHLGSSEAIEIGSIEKTAAAYIELIRSIRPTGPYLLAGYSFGGLVAYEMAKQLAAAGESVPYLALFDTLNPVAPIRSYSITERVAVRWRSQNGMPLLGKVKTLAERFANGVETSRRIKAEVAAAERALPADAHSELRAVQLREAHHEAMKAYQPSFYAGKMTLFRADAVNDKFEVPSDYGWSHLVRELEILDVPGEHLTLFDKENAPALARAFAKGLH